MSKFKPYYWRKTAYSGGFLRWIELFMEIIYFVLYGLLLLVRPRI